MIAESPLIRMVGDGALGEMKQVDILKAGYWLQALGCIEALAKL